jgi:ATP-dependent Clp protease ATP-binding subunit ClpC
MRPSLLSWYSQTISSYGKASLNLFTFLPYFFSVSQMLQTLLQPWKRIVDETKSSGFSFSDLGSRLSMNLISRWVGATVRLGMLGVYISSILLFIVMIPIGFFLLHLLLPFIYLRHLASTPPEKKKESDKQIFIKDHMEQKENQAEVEKWFDLKHTHETSKPWWTWEQLKLITPLGHDWTTGYTPTLDLYSVPQPAASSDFHLYGRDTQVEAIQQALIKSSHANAVIVGEAGVGKQAIIRALTDNIANGRVTEQLIYKRIRILDLERLLAQTTDQVQREELFKKIIDEAQKAGSIILVIYDIDRYVSSEKGRIDLTKVFDQIAASGEIHFIATTTPFAYQKYLQSLALFQGSFEKVSIGELSIPDTKSVLLDSAIRMEKKLGMTVTYEALTTILEKAELLITSLPQPEKTLDTLDDITSAASQKKIKQVTKQWVLDYLTEKTHIPVDLNEDIKQKLLSLDGVLRGRIIQQEEAVNAVSGALRKSFVLSRNSKRPLGSFLFLGPTGVGKTETAKVINELFFGAKAELLRLDMSQFQAVLDIPKLIGGEEGNPGLMPKMIREHPYGMLLLDELEKAHKDLINIFLTILDEGYFMDGTGQRVDCKNLIVVATSNAGADLIYSNIHNPAIKKDLIDYLVKSRLYSPEFLNRFDAVVVYRPLEKPALARIALGYLGQLVKDVQKQYGVGLSIAPEFVVKIIQETYDPRWGARNLQRALRDKIEALVAEQLLQKEKPKKIKIA